MADSALPLEGSCGLCNQPYQLATCRLCGRDTFDRTWTRVEAGHGELAENAILRRENARLRREVRELTMRLPLPAKAIATPMEREEPKDSNELGLLS